MLLQLSRVKKESLLPVHRKPDETRISSLIDGRKALPRSLVQAI